MKKHNLTFLFGSGTSISLGIPNTTQITNKIYPLDNIILHTDSHFYFGKPPNEMFPEYTEYNPIINRVLGKIKSDIEEYCRITHHDHMLNYEDYYFLSSELLRSVSSGYVNPAIFKYKEEFVDELIDYINEDRTALEIFRKTIQYFEDMLRSILFVRPEDYSNLGLILDAILDSEFGDINIFTLNHDIILEEMLKKHRVIFIDGFDKPINQVRYWNRYLFDEKEKVKLYKLHGSISWLQFISEQEEYEIKFGNIDNNPDIYHLKDKKGEYMWPYGNARMIVGTYNKPLLYAQDVFIDLHYRFHDILNKDRILIIIGYGFKDGVINKKIWDYVNNYKYSKIIIINPDAEGQWIIEKNKPDNCYKIIRKNIENVSWDDVKEILLNSIN